MYTLKTKMALLWTVALASLLALTKGQDGVSVSISYPNDVPREFSTILEHLLALHPDDNNCCPHPEPNTCPFTLEPLQYYISYNPNKLCKVLPCFDADIQVAKCTCEECTSLMPHGVPMHGRCMPSGYTDYWVRVQCSGFEYKVESDPPVGTLSGFEYKVESEPVWTLSYIPTWERISVPTSCRCRD